MSVWNFSFIMLYFLMKGRGTMIYILMVLSLILFYIPSYIFYKKSSDKVLEVKRGKGHNFDFWCLFILLIISTFLSTLEICEVVSISSFFRRVYDVIVSFVLLVCMVRHFYYTLLENYNKVRIFLWPLLLFIVFIYVFVCFIVDVNLSGWLGFNKLMIGSLDIFTWYYIILDVIYLIVMIVVPMVCYKKRESLLGKK